MILFFIVIFVVCYRERKKERVTEHEQGRDRERERERERENLKQAPGSELSAQSQTQGLNSRISRSRPEPKSDA